MSGLTHHNSADRYWDRGDAASGLRAERAERLFRQERLTQTIESEIIPRLMMAHQNSEQSHAAPGLAETASLPGPADILELADRLCAADPLAAASYVHTLCGRGMKLDVLFLDLFAPAARHLGDLWEADLCDFVDVTMGLSRLQQLLRELAPAFEREGSCEGSPRSILLMPAPGENHTFGLAMVEQFFRRSGWDVWTEGPRSLDDLAAFLHGMWFGVVGLSVSGDKLLDELAAAIRTIRRDSLNPQIGVIVGGRVFMDHPDAVERVGADATATDARDAVRQAQALLGLEGIAASR